MELSRSGPSVFGLNVTEAGDLVGPCAADALGKRRTLCIMASHSCKSGTALRGSCTNDSP